MTKMQKKNENQNVTRGDKEQDTMFEYPLPTSPVSKPSLVLDSHRRVDAEQNKSRYQQSTREVQTVRSEEHGSDKKDDEFKEENAFDNSNVTISLDTSQGQSLNTLGGSSHKAELPPRLKLPFESDVPSWIPREERRYWTEDSKNSHAPLQQDEKLNEMLYNRNDTPRSRSKLKKWLLPSNWNWGKFWFLRKSSTNSQNLKNGNVPTPTGGHHGLPSSPQACSSARRSFRSKGKNVFWNVRKDPDPEDRMSVNRVAYNAALQSPTIVRRHYPSQELQQPQLPHEMPAQQQTSSNSPRINNSAMAAHDSAHYDDVDGESEQQRSYEIGGDVYRFEHEHESIESID